MSIIIWIQHSLLIIVLLGSLCTAFQFPRRTSSLVTPSISKKYSISSISTLPNSNNVLYTSSIPLPGGSKPGTFSFFNFNNVNKKKLNKNENHDKEPTQPITSLFGENDSDELKKARVKVAEVQGLLPIGASELPLETLLQQSSLISSGKGKTKSMKDMRELYWRVAEPETRYDPSKFSKSSFFAQPWRWLKRNLAIFVPFSWFIIRVLGDAFFGSNSEEQRTKRARQLLHIISQQSPAVIKAGQALSSRSDLLPKEYLQSLQLLQDRVPPFSTQEAMILFQEETGYALDEVFDLASFQPIAAASIGQVYKGRLKSTGEMVAIKIQRPKCEEVIGLDLQVMRWYCQIMQHVLSVMGRTVDLVSVIDDFGELLYREIDYRAEAANAQRFAELYGSMPDIYVPKIYPHLSTKRVLTMEWIDGVRLTDVAALRAQQLDPSKLVNALVQCSLRQMLENGFFHADPHGGNLLAMANGKLCYLDFGMVSYVEPLQRNAIIEAVVHLVNRDFTALTELYRRMGFIPMHADTQPIVAALETALPDVLNASVKDFNFKKMMSTLGDIMYKFPFSLPPFYIAIIRCLGVLEGLALQIDSDFRIISDAYPYIASRLLMDASPALQAALQQLLFTDTGKLRWERLEELLEKAIAIPDYDVATAIDHAVRYLVSPQATTLRVYLAEELVNGVDALESDAVEMLMQSLTWSGKDWKTLTSWKSTVLSALRSDGGGQRLDALLDKLLLLLETQRDTRSALYSMARVLKLLRSGVVTPTSSSSPSSSSPAAELSSDETKKAVSSSPINNNKQFALKSGHNLSLLLRRMLKEPVLQEWLIQMLGDVSERLSMKLLRRVFQRSATPTATAVSRATPATRASPSSLWRALFFSEEASLARREKRLEKRLRHASLRQARDTAPVSSVSSVSSSWLNGWFSSRRPSSSSHNEVSSAVSLMATAFFSGLDVLLQQQQQQQQQATRHSSRTRHTMKKTRFGKWFQPHMSSIEHEEVETAVEDPDFESTSSRTWKTRFDLETQQQQQPSEDTLVVAAVTVTQQQPQEHETAAAAAATAATE